MNKKIDLLDKLIRRKERKDAQVIIKTKKRRAQKKFAKQQRRINNGN
jgi:hypothetical protein